MSAVVIIPARLDSKRMPGKVLMNIRGKSLLQRCWESVRLCGYDPIIASGDDAILREAEMFGAKTVKVNGAKNGTERAAMAAEKLSVRDTTVVVNCQADMFGFGYLDSTFLHMPISAVEKSNCFVATNGYLVTGSALLDRFENVDIQSRDTVKVILGTDGFARFFSREVLSPTSNCAMAVHYGVYAAKSVSFSWYLSCRPTLLEEDQKLEQLRWRDPIYVCLVNDVVAKIDNEDDLKKADSAARFHDLYMAYYQLGSSSGACGECIDISGRKQLAWRKTLAAFRG